MKQLVEQVLKFVPNSRYLRGKFKMLQKNRKFENKIKSNFDQIFKFDNDDDINTLMSNAINTYIHLAALVKDEKQIFFGGPDGVELRRMRFPFEDVSEISEYTVKLR